MKLRLVVQTEGSSKGKVLDITLAQFVIGRDPQCHLRPASPLISKRHCAVVKREGKVFLQDFDSTNGTILNDQPIKGEVELNDGDVLKVGPLIFGVKIDASVSIEKSTPLPATTKAAAAAIGKSVGGRPKKSSGASDDEIAALLLDDDTDTGGPLAEEKVPEGSTVMDLAALQAKEEAAKQEEPKADEKKPAPQVDTRSAAESILKKYMKRPRK